MTDTSFTQRVVAELAPHVPVLPCCRRSLLQGMLLVSDRDDVISTTRLVAARVAMQTLHTDSLPGHVRRVRSARRARYVVDADATVVGALSSRLCCTRSRLRGAFLSCGRLQRPDAGPYLEISCPSSHAASALTTDVRALGVGARVRVRGRRWIVTVRSASGVAGVLSSIGAQSGRLDYEGGRVVRDVRSSVNRRLNAETANLRRTARAGVAQLRAVRSLEADTSRWAVLAPALREAALLRTRHPQEDLAALARRAQCSRSAMAGRLRRLVAIAAVT
ncbi:MAG: DNA-binding protein WhiA [Candidatus Dormibacteria bacterium]